MNHGEHGEHGELRECEEWLIEKVIGAAITVHRHLGPGLLESVYELALMIEFAEARIPAERQVGVPVLYRGHDLGVGFRADIIVASCLLLELKSTDLIAPAHIAQTINYLKLLRFKRGLILNFNRKVLKEGIRRVSI